MTLDLLLTASPETPIRDLCTMLDRYDLALDLEHIGRKADWDKQVMAWSTCEEVQEWVEGVRV